MAFLVQKYTIVEEPDKEEFSERAGRLVEMIRKRIMSKWSSFEQYLYSSQEEFFKASPTSGTHTVNVHGQGLDLLFIDRGASTTTVVFHAALSRGATRIPAFKGLGLTADTGTNLIAVADPTIGMGDVDLAWFLGNEVVGYLPPVMAPLIQHLIDSAEIKEQKIILFGTSGGGYAAVNFASYFPGALCLSALPRLDLTARPEINSAAYLRAAFPTCSQGDVDNFVEEHLKVPLYEKFRTEPMQFDLGIFHNLGDVGYYLYQVYPFLEQVWEVQRVFTRVEWYGKGHLIIPGHPYRELVSAVDSTDSNEAAFIKAGFSSTRKKLISIPD